MVELEVFVMFVTAMFLTFISVPLIRRFAHAFELYDHPDLALSHGASVSSRRIHSQPIPRLGGIAIIFGFFVSTFLWISHVQLKPVYIGSCVLFVVGLLDDFLNLSAKFRLFFQVLVAGLVVWTAGLSINELVITKTLILSISQPFGFLMSMFIIVGAINSINLIDGLDGLAGGIVLIGVLLLSLLHFLASSDVSLILGMGIPLLGSILGFLCYNTHPASIFMGDGGSNWLGFMIGALALMVMKGAGNAEIATTQVNPMFISVLMCLAIPICDTATVIISRIRAGNSPFAADKGHFHHNLMNLGLSHPQAVGTIYFLALMFGICGIMPSAYPAFRFDLVPYLSAITVAIVIPSSLYMNSHFVRRIAVLPSRIGLDIPQAPIVKWALDNLDVANRYCIYGMFAIAPILAGTPPAYVGIAAAIGFMLLLLTTHFKSQATFFHSLVISICCSILLVAINFNTLGIELMGTRYNIQFIYNYSFIFLLGSTIIIAFATIKKTHLIITPSDFLMVCVPLLYLLIPEPFRSEYKLNLISLRSLVLFVALRALARRHPMILRRIRAILYAGLGYVVLASVFGLKIVY